MSTVILSQTTEDIGFLDMKLMYKRVKSCCRPFWLFGFKILNNYIGYIHRYKYILYINYKTYINIIREIALARHSYTNSKSSEIKEILIKIYKI